MIDKLYEECTLCPRLCHVNRHENFGFCHAKDSVEIALVSLHKWEEPCLSGTNGAGTVFFSHCNMRCIFCQNHEISTEGKGISVSPERLAQIFLEQQARHAHCLDLVTPTHYVPHIIETLDIAKAQGFNLPVVYNTSGYEREETLLSLKNYVDIFLPDFKYYASDTASECSKAPDYPQIVKHAIETMYKLVGKPVFDEHGIMQKGIIIRHLILPWHYKESMAIVKYIWETYGDNVYLSLMNQYTPMYKALNHPKLNRRLTTFEYDKVVNYAADLGITKCFIQEGKTATTKFVPHFDGSNVLSDNRTTK